LRRPNRGSQSHFRPIGVGCALVACSLSASSRRRGTSGKQTLLISGLAQSTDHCLAACLHSFFPSSNSHAAPSFPRRDLECASASSPCCCRSGLHIVSANHGTLFPSLEGCMTLLPGTGKHETSPSTYASRVKGCSAHSTTSRPPALLILARVKRAVVAIYNENEPLDPSDMTSIIADGTYDYQCHFIPHIECVSITARVFKIARHAEPTCDEGREIDAHSIMWAFLPELPPYHVERTCEE
jgi:hypothetical protein